MFNKIINFKSNIFQSFIIIFVINLILFITYYGKLGMFFIDVSREVYIPTQMNNGELLYKNIFNIFTPLGYQLNAFLTNIFGENLHTFYWIGFVNSTLILFGLFLILRFFVKSKEFSTVLSLLSLFLIMVTCLYSVSLTNYIFPYSYSLIFALNSIIWAIVTILYFLKKNKTKDLYLTSLLYGLSIAFKYDFILFGIPLLVIILLSKKSLKEKLTCIVLTLCPITISFAELLLKRVTITELLTAFNYISGIATSKSNTFLYKYLGFFPTIKSLKEVLINFIIVNLTIFVYYISINKTIKCFIQENKKKFFYIGLLILIIISPYYLFINKFISSNAFYFNWIGLALLFLIIPFLKKMKEKTLEKKEIIFLTFLVSVILLSTKSIFNISFNSYGTYYFPLLFITILTYLYANIKTTSRKTIITIIFMISTLFCISNIERTKYSHSCEIKTEKGKIFVSKEFCSQIKNINNYIEKNTNKNDTILVLPEGAMINFLTNRKSNNLFIHLIPPNLEALNEDFVVKELKKDLPNYIVLQSMSYNNFGQTYFCESFGQKICGLIPQYYESPIVFGDNFWLAIYKKKETNEK